MKSSNANLWVHSPFPHGGGSLRLFCFPYAGGGAAPYRKWSELLPAGVEVCPVLLPGREARLGEKAFSSVFPLVDAMAPAIAPYLDKPFVFFGHSMGALVAFELTRKIRRERNTLPECLFVSARVAPGFALRRPPMSALPEEEFIRELARFNGSEQGALQHAELLKLLLPTLRADFALHEQYQYIEEAALECPIVAFGGLQDQATEVEGLDAWRSHTNRSFVRRMFSGDHFFINAQQSLFMSKFAQELQWVLAKIGRGASLDCRQAV